MFEYKVPGSWYAGAYEDKAEVIPAARSFSFLHEIRSDKAVLLIHGYAGYPGELIHPAKQLYEAGFDVFCPRLPGMGTSGKDFMRSRSSDWIKVILNASADLSLHYASFNTVSHSMGTLLAIIASIEYPVDKMVLCAPALSLPAFKGKPLGLISLFKKDVPAPWQSDSRYHLHYENAPCDDALLGREYWSHMYMKQLSELKNLSLKASKAFLKVKGDLLMILCADDVITDIKGAEALFNKRNGDRDRLCIINGATHYVYYDILEEAEKKAVEETLSFLLLLP